jgi:protoporphyrinogen oxidase
MSAEILWMNDPGRIAIIGAGPTGLGAAWRLAELGHDDFVIVDRRGFAGGLASSFIDDHGFTWDIGGHVQFSHYAYYDDVLDSLPIEWLHHQRESWVWFKERFVPYPFQNNIHRLDAEDRAYVLQGLEDAARERLHAAKAANFREWIDQTFGEGMAALFLVPYNRKVWAWPPETLDASWVGDRVAVPDLDRIRRNIAEHRDDVSWGPNNTFRFPLHGGTGAIWLNVAQRIDPHRLQFDSAVERIDFETRELVLAGGRTIRYDTLINTMPLPELCRLVPSAPSDVTRAADSLVSSSTHVFGVGLRGEIPRVLARKCWMYFPESHNPYYRVTVFSNYSPKNVPDGGYWSLMAEVSESPVKAVDGETLFDDVIEAMRRDRLIGDSTVVSRWHHFERYGYPTPSLGRDAALEVIHRGLEPLRVFSRGRFGAWKYEVSNQDHSFMQGVELADRLTGAGEEHTLPRPDHANSGAFLRRSEPAYHAPR